MNKLDRRMGKWCGQQAQKKPCYLALCFVRNHKANSIKLPLDNEYVIVKKREETLYILFV